MDHTTIFRWVQAYAPEIDKRSRPHLKPTHDSWRMDETSVKVKGQWMYLYRAVDSTGQTLDFLLNETRCTRAAKRFFHKVLGGRKRVAPSVIKVDQNAAYIGAVRDLKAAGLLPDYGERRPVKYLSNIVEQDHRFIKRRVKPGLRKGQIEGVEKGDRQAQHQFIAGLFGLTV